MWETGKPRNILNLSVFYEPPLEWGFLLSWPVEMCAWLCPATDGVDCVNNNNNVVLKT